MTQYLVSLLHVDEDSDPVLLTHNIQVVEAEAPLAAGIAMCRHCEVTVGATSYPMLVAALEDAGYVLMMRPLEALLQHPVKAEKAHPEGAPQ